MSLLDTTVCTFPTKSGQLAAIRYVAAGDAELLTPFINQISQENIFVRFSGEVLTIEEETRYINSEIEAVEMGDAVKLFCLVDGELVGVSDVHRNISFAQRKLHIGVIGLIVAEKFRGQGIGKKLMQTCLNEAQQHIEGLRMIQLECFAPNTPALTLYRQLGFREVGRVPGALLHRGEYVDEVVMVKELSSTHLTLAQ